jgi:hypothetical protein
VIVRSLSVTAGALLAATLIGGCGGSAGDTGDSELTPTGEAGHWERISGPTPLPEAVPVVVGDRVALIGHAQGTLSGLVLDLPTRRWSRAAPSGLWWRYGFSAVDAGGRVIVWGGCCGAGGRGSRAAGAIYDLARDRWRARRGPFGDRYDHAAVSTGKEMIVWGGFEPPERPVDPDEERDFNEAFAAEGAAYDPRTNRWRGIAPAPLSPHSGPAAVWTGKEMIVWGGSRPAGLTYERLLYDGAAYDPDRNRWRKLAPTRFLSACVPAWKPRRCGTSPPTARVPYSSTEEEGLRAAWTGREVLIWSNNPYVAAGAAYEPDRDRWERIARPPADIPMASEFSDASAVWTGEELIVWGGIGDTGDEFVSLGAAYDLEAERWKALPEAPVRARAALAAVWTGSGMLVWAADGGGAAHYAP